jgi:DNA mismatch endonuclease (patch repair protein)
MTKKNLLATPSWANSFPEQPPWFRYKRRKYENTSIEVKVQKFLKREGIPFKTQIPILGKPDIFVPPNILIMCDGCYFHLCPKCGYGKRGSRKDKKITEQLQKRGYKVLRFWEHEINGNFKAVKEIIKREYEIGKLHSA